MGKKPDRNELIRTFALTSDLGRAAASSGYSLTEARAIIDEPETSERLAKWEEWRESTRQAQARNVVDKLRCIVNADILDVVTWDKEGNIKLRPITEIREETRVAIKLITPTKVELYDKIAAAERLAKIYNLYAPDDKIDIIVQVLVQVLKEADVDVQRKFLRLLGDITALK